MLSTAKDRTAPRHDAIDNITVIKIVSKSFIPIVDLPAICMIPLDLLNDFLLVLALAARDAKEVASNGGCYGKDYLTDEVHGYTFLAGFFGASERSRIKKLTTLSSSLVGVSLTMTLAASTT